MKLSTLFSFLFSIISFFSFSQNSTQEGYYIDKLGDKHEGFIKNLDWRNNPTSIEFKSSLNEKLITIEKENINEFGIYNSSKFVKYVLKIEKSSSKVSNLVETKEPSFVEEEALLKVIVEGDANLYKYENSNIVKYFYSKNNETPKQLIFIEYLNENNNIAKNEDFKRELFSELNCNFDRDFIKELKYTETSLKKYFQKYNSSCGSKEYISYNTKKTKYNLKAEVKANFINYEFPLFNFTSDKSVKPSFGFEFEAVFPYNNNSFSLIINPTYGIYNIDNIKTDYFGFSREYEIKYSNVNIPFGIRYYIYLSENSKLFITPSFELNYSVSNDAGIYRNNQRIEKFEPSSNYAIGLGYSFQKFYFEAKYITNSRIVEYSNSNKDSNFKNISLGLKYQIF